jgi:serine/threonine protein kinase
MISKGDRGQYLNVYIQRYAVKMNSLLGEGSYSKVYNHRDSALKYTEVSNEEDLTAIARELYILNMNLPGMVPFKSCFYKWNAMHILLERAENSLSKYLRIVRMEEKEIRSFVIQILHAVYQLHSRDILHRDLKPANILIKGDRSIRSVWLCDFGLTRQFTNEYGTGTDYMVTRTYRAPEIWKEVGYDKPADMWSVGCILYGMLHGHAFAKNMEEIDLNVPKLKSETELDILIRGLLDPNVTNRWNVEHSLAFLGETTPVIEIKYAKSAAHISPERTKWFYMFYKEFPSEHRVLAHGLMIFDSVDQTIDNMCCSVAMAAMLFKKRPSKILLFAMSLLEKYNSLPVLVSLAAFIDLNSSHSLCDWENTKIDFEEYVNMKLG